MSNNTQIFNRLFVEHRPAVVKLCRGYVKGDAVAAEDLAQEVFVQVWRGLDRFRGEASAKTWIYRITVNVCLQEIRTRTRRPQISVEPTDIAFRRKPALSEAELAETSDADPRLQQLYQAIGTLPKVDRLVYMLMLEGQDYSEIAQVTGLTQGALRVRVHRAHDKLRKLLSNV
ncbi:MAG: RNA polymerase sigma factor [Saprospiraceae bacterium]